MNRFALISFADSGRRLRFHRCAWSVEMTFEAVPLCFLRAVVLIC
jgi:hypothetical protein